ncbi:GNAT family N-acetyltransferase [Hydrogenophaga flava]|uniref:GNAT family N-acetyltransferase n=1 Tax=Hydrogenophaga flava TaxID=65657 RepID=UPI000824AD70|nr:GNAT family N-acetyltransferase [Hydrogenophaga flava]
MGSSERASVWSRAYRPADRAACIAVFASNVPHFFHEGEAQDFAAFLDGEADRYLVVLDGADIVGCGGFALDEDGREVSLCWGMLRRDRHGQGIGAQLLRARLQAIAATPAVSVRLVTSQHTAGFYRRFGFEVRSVQTDGLAPRLDAVEMRLDLATHP